MIRNNLHSVAVEEHQWKKKRKKLRYVELALCIKVRLGFPHKCKVFHILRRRMCRLCTTSQRNHYLRNVWPWSDYKIGHNCIERWLQFGLPAILAATVMQPQKYFILGNCTIDDRMYIPRNCFKSVFMVLADEPIFWVLYLTVSTVWSNSSEKKYRKIALMEDPEHWIKESCFK